MKGWIIKTLSWHSISLTWQLSQLVDRSYTASEPDPETQLDLSSEESFKSKQISFDFIFLCAIKHRKNSSNLPCQWLAACFAPVLLPILNLWVWSLYAYINFSLATLPLICTARQKITVPVRDRKESRYCKQNHFPILSLTVNITEICTLS